MATNSAGEFVGLLFLAREITHRIHLKTLSFAEHKTLNEFYDGIIPLADDFAQQYMGRYGMRIDVPYVTNKYKGTVSEVLRQQMEWIEANRQQIVPRTETALQNKIDEVVGFYQNILYQLTLQ
ncbi:hypothetical protein EBT25_01315 [bacterium]|jgi:hypothetical protein|nr:hypothetical protein [bacterium]